MRALFREMAGNWEIWYVENSIHYISRCFILARNSRRKEGMSHVDPLTLPSLVAVMRTGISAILDQPSSLISSSTSFGRFRGCSTATSPGSYLLFGSHRSIQSSRQKKNLANHTCLRSPNSNSICLTSWKWYGDVILSFRTTWAWWNPGLGSSKSSCSGSTVIARMSFKNSMRYIGGGVLLRQGMHRPNEWRWYCNAILPNKDIISRRKWYLSRMEADTARESLSIILQARSPMFRPHYQTKIV